jgi:ArsR family transcriptional regulator, arsenate/arsenite/antimonite-responsive transcriptional repressor
MDTERALAALAALAHHVRLDVWRLLLPHGSLGLSAGTIATRLAVAPSSLSFHLLQMTNGRVLVQRRFSRQVIYAINEEVVTVLFGFLTGENPLPPQAATLTVRQDGDVIRQGQSERDTFSVGDDLASAANL